MITDSECSDAVAHEGDRDASRRVKAVIFIPTLTAGGAERVASILADHWCRYPCTSVTILLMFDEELFYPLNPRVKLRNLRLRPNRGAVRRLRDLAWAVMEFRRVVRDERANFVLSFMTKYNVFCLTSLFKSGIATIVSERDSPTERNRPLTYALRRILYPLADGIITQTSASERFLSGRTGHKNIAVIYNPISRPDVPAAQHREKLVLNVGRLVTKKGQSDLLLAFAKAGVVDWSLVICGDGPLRKDLEALADQLGLAGRVRFEGTVKDVNSWYARAGVFAFSSYFEGFPNALAEALVAGVPSVSYDCPTGPSELIENGETGYLVTLGDIDELAKRLRDLMTNPALADRLSRNATRVAEKLDAAAISATYFEFCVGTAARGKT